MSLQVRTCQERRDYWRIRVFLREIFLPNGCQDHSWQVARFDYWRWHGIGNVGALNRA
jgi:hypothetical protein